MPCTSTLESTPSARRALPCIRHGVRFGLALLIAQSLAGCHSEPHPLCVELEAVASESDAVVAERQPRFLAALSDLNGLAEQAGTEPCPIRDARFEPDRVTEPASIGQLLPSSLLELSGADSEVGLFRSTCGVGDTVSQTGLVKRYREAIDTLPARFDLVVIQRQRTDPVMQSPTTFSPGSLDVLGLVYSHAEQRVVCTGLATASNRQEVLADRSLRDTDYLQLDLNRQAIWAVRERLQVLPAP